MPDDPTLLDAAAKLAELATTGPDAEAAAEAVRLYALSLPIPYRGQALYSALLIAGRMARLALANTTAAPADPAAGLPTMPCRSCGQVMIMVPHHKSGPANGVQPDPTGEIVIESGRWWTVGPASATDHRPRYTTHFAVCPEADTYRRR